MAKHLSYSDRPMKLNPLIEAAKVTGGHVFVGVLTSLIDPAKLSSVPSDGDPPASRPPGVAAGASDNPGPGDIVISDSTACRHSRGFESVVWFGEPHEFTRSQAAAVAELWAAWENRTPFLYQDGVIKACGLMSEDFAKLFAGNKAFGTMIQPGRKHGGKSGTFTLFPFKE